MTGKKLTGQADFRALMGGFIMFAFITLIIGAAIGARCFEYTNPTQSGQPEDFWTDLWGRITSIPLFGPIIGFFGYLATMITALFEPCAGIPSWVQFVLIFPMGAMIFLFIIMIFSAFKQLT